MRSAIIERRNGSIIFDVSQVLHPVIVDHQDVLVNIDPGVRADHTGAVLAL